MSNIQHRPTAEYWDELREYEHQLFQDRQAGDPLLHPGITAVDVWSTGDVEPIGVDSMAYNAIRRLVSPRRDISLVSFSFGDVSERTTMNVYQLSLRPGKETLRAFPVYGLVTQRGLADLKSESVRAQASVLARFGVDRPNFRDFHYVRDQLQRGASGVYSRWRPETEQ